MIVQVFVHAYNPLDEAQPTQTMVWRKRSEELHLSCTANRVHVRYGGRFAHFLVALAYNEGVILCKQYFGNINGDMFAQFVKDHFNETFRKSANAKVTFFLQDGDPSQNSKKAKVTFSSVDANIFPIPLRKPDMNSIENIFNIAKEKLHADALSKNITFENFNQFSKCVNETKLSIPPKT